MSVDLKLPREIYCHVKVACPNLSPVLTFERRLLYSYSHKKSAGIDLKAHCPTEITNGEKMCSRVDYTVLRDMQANVIEISIKNIIGTCLEQFCI